MSADVSLDLLKTTLAPLFHLQDAAALLDRQVMQVIGPQRMGTVPLRRKQNLAAVIHLCGAGAGRAYAARKCRLTHHQRYGDHAVKT